MKTWNEYKNHVKKLDSADRDEMENIEVIAGIICAIVERRNSLGFSQRDLAQKCGMPQSSVARIESYKMIPGIDTLLKMMKPLGLTLSVKGLSAESQIS